MLKISNLIFFDETEGQTPLGRDDVGVFITSLQLQAVVLEGKYWKRKLATVTAEYKKWRMFYKNKIMGWTAKDGSDMVIKLKR